MSLAVRWRPGRWQCVVSVSHFLSHSATHVGLQTVGSVSLEVTDGDRAGDSVTVLDRLYTINEMEHMSVL